MKTITNLARGENAYSRLHLFEFDLYDLDGVFVETLRLTDHDIFVNYNGADYTPLSITFDSLTEDISMQSNNINLTIDNVNEEMTSRAFQYDFRGNRCSIDRVVFIPPTESPVDGETYDYGYGNNLEATYPEILLDDIVNKDVYNLFTGIIDTFSATERSLSATISTEFIHWQNPFPQRTYDQREFGSIIDTMTEEIYWGRATP